MPTDHSQPDATCEHGTALDVHCCHCHSGFIFDHDHKCPPVPTMSKHLSDERLKELLEIWDRTEEVFSIDELIEVTDALRELIARRAADPTPAQRKWYREQAEECGAQVWGYAGWEEDRYFDAGAAAECARLAAHFGRLAQGVDGD